MTPFMEDIPIYSLAIPFIEKFLSIVTGHNGKFGDVPFTGHALLIQWVISPKKSSFFSIGSALK